MANLPEKILQELSTKQSLNTLDLAQVFNEDHQKIIGALKSIQANGELVNAEVISKTSLELTSEGTEIAETGTYQL